MVRHRPPLHCVSVRSWKTFIVVCSVSLYQNDPPASQGIGSLDQGHRDSGWPSAERVCTSFPVGFE